MYMCLIIIHVHVYVVSIMYHVHGVFHSFFLSTSLITSCTRICCKYNVSCTCTRICCKYNVSCTCTLCMCLLSCPSVTSQFIQECSTK